MQYYGITSNAYDVYLDLGVRVDEVRAALEGEEWLALDDVTAVLVLGEDLGEDVIQEYIGKREAVADGKAVGAG
jgi:hypothetical protein